MPGAPNISLNPRKKARQECGGDRGRDCRSGSSHFVDELRAELVDPERRRAAVAVMMDAVRGALNAATRSDPELLLTSQFQRDVSGLALGLLRR